MKPRIAPPLGKNFNEAEFRTSWRNELVYECIFYFCNFKIKSIFLVFLLYLHYLFCPYILIFFFMYCCYYSGSWPIRFLISIDIFSSNFSFKLLFLAKISPSYNIPLDPTGTISYTLGFSNNIFISS